MTLRYPKQAMKIRVNIFNGDSTVTLSLAGQSNSRPPTPPRICYVAKESNHHQPERCFTLSLRIVIHTSLSGARVVVGLPRSLPSSSGGTVFNDNMGRRLGIVGQLQGHQESSFRRFIRFDESLDLLICGLQVEFEICRVLSISTCAMVVKP